MVGKFLAAGVLTALVLTATSDVAAAIGPNRGDINGDGAISVVDINCTIAAVLAAASGTASPSCQAFPNDQVDLQCDGSLTVLDVQRIILIRLYQLAPTPDIEGLLRVADKDFDGLHDNCEPDTDGDGIIDDDDVCPGVPDPEQLDVDNDGLGDACDPDSCTGTICVPDGNPCTADTCNPATGLCSEPVFDGTACDADGNGCTVDDACAAGICVPGAAPDCSTAADSCNQGVCDSAGPGSFACVPVPIPGPCDDADACTEGDACVAGACAGSPVTCADDGNPCTTTSCDALLGCQDTSNSDPCNDNDVCTDTDVCTGGLCVGTPDPSCQCAGTPDCAQYENGNLCDGTLICVANQCVVDPGTVVTCTQPANVCLTSVCQPLTGVCAQQNAQAGKPCNDSNLCTLTDVCNTGTCAGTLKTCPNDGNACTNDVCNPTNGACGVVVAAGTPCNDAKLCTIGDKCTGTVCAGTPVVCSDDGNACTSDVCDTSSGACGVPVANGASCDADGDGCTVGDICTGGACVPGAPPDCSTVADVCNQGVCDSSGPSSFTCAAVPIPGPCDDNDACTEGDSCLAGACEGAPVSCADDGNPCTTTSCVALLGCQDTPNNDPCDDNDVCTDNDVCASGLCAGTPNPSCQCADTAGCAQYENGNLCDGTLICVDNQCTVDPSTVVSCTQPANVCRTSVCQALSGQCLEQDAQAGKPCDDSNLCTLTDVCNAGTCAGTLKTCPNDSNACTNDVCNPTNGVCGVAVAPGTPCDDAKLCTTGDQCAGTVCGGAPVACFDDGNACTNDICDQSTGGCGVPVANGASCDADTDGCTVGDACDSGVCLQGAAPDCTAASDDCNLGVCLSGGPGAFSCVPQPMAGPCNDGDLCTTSDVCGDGSCAGTPVTCPDDGNSCTNDVCDPANGACGVSVGNGTPCDADGSGCTQGDVCTAGQCLAGGAVDCSSVGDACNVGACASTGPTSHDCVQDPAPLEGNACDDEEPCTVPDTCTAGACGGPTWPACEDPGAGLICLLWGLSGQTVDCELHLARAAFADPPAVNLQAEWSWDPTAASLAQFQDGEKCFAPGVCVPYLIPSSFSALQSGHSVNLDPTALTSWNGNGRMIMANVQDAAAPVTDAWLEGPVLQGDSLVVTAHFTLKKDIPATSPSGVTLSNIVMSDKDLAPLDVQTLQLLLRTTPAP